MTTPLCDRPVIAAGGIGDGRGPAAALALGAPAGWLGTRFLTAEETATHDTYRQAVCRASAGDTVHTTCFDGGRPDAPYRVLGNRTLEAWERASPSAAPDRPGSCVIRRVAAGPRVSR
ncbi:hypothetical protein GCM10009733_044330 [Nonomuraea maheshkhaliensis]|uniref:Nitronate monooxygenase domain-containing protein n=1 Tax=Nonomuraea maheshkhaliensis TaxID=419590 RepID=A0ABN2FEF8_9ACTN